jgi:peptidoglycan/LPS O-acetylase OafA/YrhL
LEPALNSTHEKNGSIEWVRILAALGIVCFHAQTGLAAQIGYAGLPAFIAISFFLLGDVGSSGGLASRPWRGFLDRRAKRLLVPWIAWIAIYLIFDLGLAMFGLRRDVDEVVSSFNPLFGTRLHLWYLPFVFLGMLAVRLIAPACVRVGGSWLVALALVLAALSGVVLPEVLDLAQLPSPVPQFLQGTSALCYGIAIAHLVTVREPGYRTAGILGVAVAAVAIAVMRDLLNGNSWIPYGVGVSVTCLAILWPTREDAFSRVMAPLSLGIYLAHPMVVGAIHRSALMHRLGLPEQLTFIVAFIGSALFVYGLRQTPLKALV